MNLFNFLPGYKTYIVGIGMILGGFVPFLTTGDFSQIDWELMGEGFGFITLRKGIKSVAN